jgi:small subunit ribosomal protein S18
MSEYAKKDFSKKQLPSFPSLSVLLGKKPQSSRRKQCPLSGPTAPKIDYKNVKLLSKFISERGKLIPSRITSVSVKKQRELAAAIKRARFLGLLPYLSAK